MKNEEVGGLPLHPSLSLEEHLSKFPSWDDKLYWTAQKTKEFKALRYSLDCLAWFKEHEKLFKAKVSQIQDQAQTSEKIRALIYDADEKACTSSKKEDTDAYLAVLDKKWVPLSTVKKALLEGGTVK